jgi:hypothetical protein
MKPKIICYHDSFGRDNLSIIKNDFVIDIACSEKFGQGAMFSEEDQISIFYMTWTEVRARDLALYTHWPVHTKEFWDLLNET